MLSSSCKDVVGHKMGTKYWIRKRNEEFKGKDYRPIGI
jgi:hypothetical protein